MAARETVAERDAIKTITTHYIDGAYVESHGREVMDIINPTNGKVIGPASQHPTYHVSQRTMDII